MLQNSPILSQDNFYLIHFETLCNIRLVLRGYLFIYFNRKDVYFGTFLNVVQNIFHYLKKITII